MKKIWETFNYWSSLTKVFDRSTPAMLFFFVTNRCNAGCDHCFYWRDLNKKEKKELSLEEVKKISSSMGEIIWLYLSGGEPFLRNDLVEICKTFYLNNKPNNINIPTNGILVKKIVQDVSEIAHFCRKSKIVVSISIDEIEKRHDRMRGVNGVFAKIEALIPQLQSLQKKYKNLAIQANIVFCQYNQARINKIYDYILNKFGIDNICISLVRGEPKKTLLKNVDLGKYWQAHERLRENKRFKHYNLLLSYLITKKEDMQAEIFLKSFKNKKAIIPCLAGRQAAVLYPTGNLSACELRSEMFGNLRNADYDFSKLWLSTKAKKLRKKFTGCYCTHECVYTANVFLNPLIWPKFFKYLVFEKI